MENYHICAFLKVARKGKRVELIIAESIGLMAMILNFEWVPFQTRRFRGDRLYRPTEMLVPFIR